MITRITTRSGSIYELDEAEKMIRAVQRHGLHRIGPEWKAYQDVILNEYEPMWVFWGPGRDEYSPDDDMPDDHRNRVTFTSTVIAIERAQEVAA